MKKSIVRCISVIVIFVFAVTLAACSFFPSKKEKDAIKAFDEILTILPAEEKDGWFQVISPDGGARFVFSNDCAGLAVDAAPFIAAGLDPVALNLDTSTHSTVYKSVFYELDLGFCLPSWDMLNRNVKDTAPEQFKADIKQLKTKYNNDTGYFSIDFDDALFEWASVSEENKTGIVFTLNPEPLIAAGVDPQKGEGWTYSQVKVTGKKGQAWRFQKTADLSDLM